MGRKIFIESMNAVSQFSLFPETSPTNSSQSDILQVKPFIIVNYPSKSESRSLDIFDIRFTIQNYIGLIRLFPVKVR